MSSYGSESMGKSEVTSMVASLTGRLTAFHPPPPPQITKPAGPVIATGFIATGLLTVARFVPHGNWRTHLLANSPVGGLLGPEALPLVGRAPGCDLSDPSQVMEPRGPTSHTATAMDPVHGSQSSFGSTDVTLTVQRGAALEQLRV